MKLVVSRSNADTLWRVRTIGDNGEPLNITEGYVNRAHAIDIARKLCPPGATIDVVPDN